MIDEHLLTWLMGRDGSARDGALRGLLAALWSFLQHPALHFEDHLAAIEQRVKGLEARLVGDLTAAVDTGVVAVESSIASVERRLEQDFGPAIHERVAAIQTRLETVKKRVVEDLKRELRRVALIATLVMGCAVMSLIALVFGLMAAWTALKDHIGSVGASVALCGAFLLASVVLLGMLRSDSIVSGHQAPR